MLFMQDKLDEKALEKLIALFAILAEIERGISEN